MDRLVQEFEDRVLNKQDVFLFLIFGHFRHTQRGQFLVCIKKLENHSALVEMFFNDQTGQSSFDSFDFIDNF